MHDQANHLRKLVFDNSRAAFRRSGDSPPRLIAVGGGRQGVGVSSIAVGLSMSLVHEGQRVVVVDADTNSPTLAALCGVDDSYHIRDVLERRRGIHEVLQRGPGGILVLPGNRSEETESATSPYATRWLLEELNQLSAHADVIVMDLGSQLDVSNRTFWDAAHQIFLVAKLEEPAVMDAYATIKFLGRDATARLQPIFNMIAKNDSAESAIDQLTQACQRYLGVTLSQAITLPYDAQLNRGAERRAEAFGWAQTPWMQAVERVTRSLLDTASAKTQRDSRLSAPISLAMKTSVTALNEK